MEKNAGIKSDLVLVFRFALATPILLFIEMDSIHKLPMSDFLLSVGSAFLFGYLPLKCLFRGLRGGRLTDLAVADTLIPLVTFVGSWTSIEADLTLTMVFGVLLVAIAFPIQVWLNKKTSTVDVPLSVDQHGDGEASEHPSVLWARAEFARRQKLQENWLDAEDG